MSENLLKEMERIVTEAGGELLTDLKAANAPLPSFKDFKKALTSIQTMKKEYLERGVTDEQMTAEPILSEAYQRLVTEGVDGRVVVFMRKVYQVVEEQHPIMKMLMSKVDFAVFAYAIIGQALLMNEEEQLQHDEKKDEVVS